MYATKGRASPKKYLEKRFPSPTTLPGPLEVDFAAQPLTSKCKKVYGIANKLTPNTFKTLSNILVLPELD